MSIACSATAQEPVLPVLSAPILKTLPVIDGTIDEAEWAQAARVEGLGPKGAMLDPRASVFWVGLTETHLYLAVKSEAPPSGLLSRARPNPNADVISAYLDDNLELWLAPHRAKAAGDRRHFQIIVNELGAKYDVSWDAFNKQQEQDTTWTVDWTYANAVKDGCWHVEMAIALASLGADKTNLALPWGLRVVRNFYRPHTCAQWGPNKAAYSNMEDAGTLRPALDGIRVRQLSLQDPQTGAMKAVFALANTSTTPRTVRFVSTHQAADSQKTEKDETIPLAAGEEKTVELAASETRGLCAIRADVTSPDGKDVYFRCAYSFRLDRPTSVWTIDSEDARKILFDMAYYPYHNTLKARLDISALPDKDKVTGAKIAVRPKDGGAALAEAAFGAFRQDATETLCTLPDLPDGEYVAEAVVAGVPASEAKPLTRTFVRTHFEWEKNTLGITDKAVPPFTPLTAKDNVVACVLREHRMNGEGLWDQVTSEGKALLAAPMRFEVAAGGTSQTVTPEAALAYAQDKENEIRATARWKAGPLTAILRTCFEMDGMMKVEMDLAGDGKTPIEQLDLVVPLRDDVAPLMHACPDRHLVAYTGTTPRGDGLIWESKQGSRTELPGTFLPYLWLGNERQGLCWFADSDRGWLTDDKQSVITLRRESGRLELRVRFVTRPAPVEKRPTIVFALQATPSKPMPVTPKHWRRWIVSSGAHPDQFHLQIMGSCYYWGSWGPCHDVYPRDKDFAIYDLIAATRRTGKPDDAAWDAYLKGFGDDPKKTYTNHLRGGKSMAAGQPDALVPYTNARGANFLEEFQTFQDEWLLSAYTPREWDAKAKGAGVAYDVSPVRSYQDFSLFYFDKMLKSGAMDGIYFDCVFLKGNFDVVAGGAYYGDDGALRPAADLFAMREYLKRAAILAWQNGRAWFNISHMTSTQIVSINGWAGANLSWEHKYGVEDFQDRFSRDYIRVDTLGQQSGCVPLVLGAVGIRGGENFWLRRTLLGVTLVHEIKDWGHGRIPLFAEVYQHLYDFGYGTDACTVRNYWDADFPVSITGVDASALLLHKPGEALIAVTSFGEGGHCTLTLDGKTLGLPAAGEFTDMESNRVVAAAVPPKPFAGAFALPKHDFRLLRYRAKDTK